MAEKGIYKQIRKWRVTAKYVNARRWFLEDNPYCQYCLRDNVHRAATEMDHIIPAWQRPDLFWEESNWQGLCAPCHKVKSDAERRDMTRVTFDGDIERLTATGWQVVTNGRRTNRQTTRQSGLPADR